jgi:pilus assembly protein Flp/PilA
MKILKQFLADEAGATAIEYALIASLIAIALIGTFTALQDDITAAFEGIGDAINPPATPP